MYPHCFILVIVIKILDWDKYPAIKAPNAALQTWLYPVLAQRGPAGPSPLSQTGPAGPSPLSQTGPAGTAPVLSPRKTGYLQESGYKLTQSYCLLVLQFPLCLSGTFLLDLWQDNKFG